MKCPICNTENRDERAECYHCQADLSALRLLVTRAKQHYNNAIEHAERKRYDQAIIELKSALELYNDFPTAHNVLGTIYAKQGKYQAAIAEWEETLALNPVYKKAHDYILQAQSYLPAPSPYKRRLGFSVFLNVLFFITASIAIFYIIGFKRAEITFLTAQKYYRQKNYALAEKMFNKSKNQTINFLVRYLSETELEKLNTELNSLLQKAEEKASQKEYEAGIELCNKLLTFNLSHFWNSKVVEKKREFATKLTEEKLKEIDRLIEKNEFSTIKELFDLLAKYTVSEFNIPDSLKQEIMHKRKIVADKEAAFLLTEFKKAYAKAEWKKAFDLANSIPLERIKEQDKKELLERLEKIKPKIALLYWQEISSIWQQKKLAEVEETAKYSLLEKIDFILKEAPHMYFSDDALFLKGLILEGLGKYQEAIIVYQKQSEQYPDRNFIDDALYRIGYCYEQMKDYPRAIETYETFLKKFPKGVYTKEVKVRIQQLKELTKDSPS